MGRGRENRWKGVALTVTLTAISPALQQASGVYDTPEWKKEIAAGKVPYRKVTLDDYPVRDNEHPDTGMYTEGFLVVEYEAAWSERTRPAKAWVTSWTVRSGLNRTKSSRRSWFKDTTGMLPHEQGHLDINEIYAKAMIKRGKSDLPTGVGFRGVDALKDLDRKLEPIVNAILNANTAEQAKYDQETEGGMNPDKQKEWAKSIQERMQRAGIVRP